MWQLARPDRRQSEVLSPITAHGLTLGTLAWLALTASVSTQRQKGPEFPHLEPERVFNFDRYQANLVEGYRGAGQVYLYRATWCVPCRGAMPMVRLTRRHVGAQ